MRCDGLHWSAPRWDGPHCSALRWDKLCRPAYNDTSLVSSLQDGADSSARPVALLSCPTILFGIQSRINKQEKAKRLSSTEFFCACSWLTHHMGCPTRTGGGPCVASCRSALHHCAPCWAHHYRVPHPQMPYPRAPCRQEPPRQQLISKCLVNKTSLAATHHGCLVAGGALSSFSGLIAPPVGSC